MNDPAHRRAGSAGLATTAFSLFLLAGCQGGVGPAGQAGAPCTVTATDAGKTITCPDGTSVTLADGATGKSCTVTDEGNGTKTIDCGGTKVTVSDGAKGTAGESCTVTDMKDGTYSIKCGGTTVIVSDGAKGDKGAGCTAVTNYDGSKVVNCEDGSSIVIVPASSEIAWDAPLPGVNVKITSVTGGTGMGGNVKPGDTITVNFTVTDDAGKNIPLSALGRARTWLSGPVETYQHILPSGTNAFDMKANPAAVTKMDGSFTYVFTAPVPATFPTQLGSTGAFPQGTLAGTNLSDGTYTLTVLARRDLVTNGATVRDVGDAQAAVLVGDSAKLTTHEVVTDSNCDSCHTAIQAHGGGYRSTKLCVTCHAAGAEGTYTPAGGQATPVPIEFSVMVHKIHEGRHLPSVNGVTVDANGARVYAAGKPFVIGTTDFSGVDFPMFPNFGSAMPKNLGYSALASANKTKEDNIRRGVTNCSVCHVGDTALARQSRRACGACHDDVDWTKPYVKNGQSMLAQANDATCAVCHEVAAAKAAHVHPMDNPSLSLGTSFSVSAVTGGTQVNPVGNFKAGDKPSITFTLKDSAGKDLAPSALDSVTSIVVGPNENRNVVFPIASAGGVQLSPFDVAPRAVVGVGASSSGTGATAKAKGAMSKVIEAGATVTETLKVQFTSGLDFVVTGTASGALGGASLAATSTYPSGGSVGSIVLDPSVVPQTIAVTFSSATAFSVTGSVSGALGSGTLPSSTAGSVFWKSNDGKIQLLVTVGANAFSASNTFNFTIFKGDVANPVLFAVVAGSLDFAAGDRFYYDYLAPAATYNLKIPMEIPWEVLGYGNATAGQAFPATANVPVYFGRQTVYEGTAVAATGSVASVVKPFERWAYLTDITGLASNDFLVFEQGANGTLGASEEFIRVSSVDASTRRVTFSTVFRFQHNPGASVKKVTAALLQEGVDYTLVPATGVITLANAKTVAATNPVFLNYRTDGAFGWKMKAAGALQDVYGPAINSSGTYAGDAWQVWTGRKYIDGTYNVSIWGYRNVYVGDQGEAQTYRDISPAAQKDFLYGTTKSVIAPYALITSVNTCVNCHGDKLNVHSRRGGDACLTCHGLAGMENGNGTIYKFGTFLHTVHVEALPAMPGGSKQCVACHGAATTWKQPSDHSYPGASLPANNYAPACTGCHDVISAAGAAHIDAMVSPITKVESCPVCHAPGKELSPERVHATR